MNRLEELHTLNEMLLAEMPEYRPQAEQFPRENTAQRRLLRSLMNLRPPRPLGRAFLSLQDQLLTEEWEARGVVSADHLPVLAGHPRLALWQGDITQLAADAIVNAANSALLGCFCPCHGCIDNAIHSAAGLQLREDCRALMEQQGHPEPNGRAKLTRAYNLPARYVLHTVGPIVGSTVTPRDRRNLANCYRSCLALAAEHGLATVAFCCISTGEFHFPNQQAAEIAVDTVTRFLQQNTSLRKVIFNVFKDTDKAIYRQLLGPDCPAERGPGPG
ncbi:MAG: protein-ADP-ribose hydrolase [Clostridiales bacterium]|nr:protein-ADP-ribose hydrolase [Clostridiales bacterium]MDY4171704.1 protein-ADP-ribose hydrolase [Evtepia sp.]